MFRRRRASDDDPTAEGSVDSTDLDEESDDDLEDELDDELDEDEDGADLRAGGPFDLDELDEDDEVERVDLGALRMVPTPEVEVRVEIDEASGQIQAVTLVHSDSALQVGVFAAPRSEGIWQEVRTQLAAGITGSGGTVDAVDGEFGPELRAKLPGEDDKGRRVMQPVRFIGVDGPRWFLRGLLSGPAVEDAAKSEVLMSAFRSVVVVRGTDPMPPHEPLPIMLPTEPVAEGEGDEPARPDLNPFRRGPEITEIR